MSGFKFSLGSTVKDKITGYQGILTSRTEWFYGCRRYNIQSQEMKDGLPVDSIGVDEDAIEVIEESGKDKVPVFKFELGSIVKDKTTPFKGIVQGRTQWIYGGNGYQVQSQELVNGIPPKNQGFQEASLEIIEKAPPYKVKSTGGPQMQPSRRKEPGR